MPSRGIIYSGAVNALNLKKWGGGKPNGHNYLKNGELREIWAKVFDNTLK